VPQLFVVRVAPGVVNHRSAEQLPATLLQTGAATGRPA
jgi:hypothetical protein